MYQNCFGAPTAVNNPFANPGAYPTAVPMPQNQSPVMSNFKIIDKPEDIMPSDIPMNGNLGVFLLRDRSMIVTKQWQSDGSIETVKFTPESTVQEDPKPDPILEKLDEIIKMMTPKATTAKTGGAKG